MNIDDPIQILQSSIEVLDFWNENHKQQKTNLFDFEFTIMMTNARFSASRKGENTYELINMIVAHKNNISSSKIKMKIIHTLNAIRQYIPEMKQHEREEREKKKTFIRIICCQMFK